MFAFLYSAHLTALAGCADPVACAAESPNIPAELLESFGEGPMTAEAINAASLAFKKALIERALGGELNHHLGYPLARPNPLERTASAMVKGPRRS